jgi:hypothetical protein
VAAHLTKDLFFAIHIVLMNYIMKAINKKAVLGTMFLIALVIFAVFACKAAGTSGGDNSPSSSGQSEGDTVDKDVLASAISVANTVRSGILVAGSEDEVPSGAKFVTQAEMDALNAMIAAAEAVKLDEKATQTGVNTAKDALLQAISDFQKNIKNGANTGLSTANPTALLTKIAEANAAKAPVAASPTTTSNAPWVAPDVLAAFNIAISDAGIVAMNPASTQKQADDAAAALEAAINTFTAAFKTPRPANFSAVTPHAVNGTTVRLDFTFSADINGWTSSGDGDLASACITLSESGIDRDGFKSGGLVKGGAGEYGQALQGISSTKTITVTVRKPGYAITPESRDVTLSYAEPASFNVSVFPGNATTTAIELQFDKAITNFSANDVYLDNAGSVTKGAAFNPAGGTDGIYKLPLNDVSDRIITVRPEKAGYSFVPPAIDVNLDYLATATFNSAFTTETDGTTSSITLAFSKDIPGLNETHITLASTNGSGASAAKGALSKKPAGTGVYELPVTTLGAGELLITVTKDAIDISSSEPRIVTLSKAAEAALADVTAVPGATPVTAALSLYFTDGTNPVSIDGLTENEITLSGLPGILKGTLVQGASTGYYTLPISGFTSGGAVTVGVNKLGWRFAGSPRDVAVSYSALVNFYLVSPVNNDVGLTTKIALYFSQDVYGLSPADVTIVKKAGNAPFDSIKGSLAQTSLGVYELGVAGFNEDTEIRVSVTKPDHYITPASRELTIKHPVPAAWSALAADTVNALTTSITLTLDKAVAGLSASDISVTKSNGSTLTGDLIRGVLGAADGAGPVTYTLPISGMTSGGNITVSVSKPGYDFTPASRTLDIVSPDVNLAGISTEFGTLGTFNAATVRYNVSIPPNRDTVIVGATAAAPSDVTVYIDGTVAPSKNVTVTGITQTVGKAVIITVMAPQGVNKSYIVYYTQDPPESIARATGGVVTLVRTGENVYEEVHTFKTANETTSLNATLTFSQLPTSGTARVLVVAGGGGGGGAQYPAGGGGAGGYLAQTYTVNKLSHTIVVGSGGEGGANNTTSGITGSPSSITPVGGGTAINAAGGGGGGCKAWNGVIGLNGGSGGGAGEGAGGTATPAGQGHDGGSATVGNNDNGGGGGAKTAGGPGVAGEGLPNDITGASTVYAAGGGRQTVPPPHTGNGGGGGWNSAGVRGASGIVIVRFAW